MNAPLCHKETMICEFGEDEARCVSSNARHPQPVDISKWHDRVYAESVNEFPKSRSQNHTPARMEIFQRCRCTNVVPVGHNGKPLGEILPQMQTRVDVFAKRDRFVLLDSLRRLPVCL